MAFFIDGGDKQPLVILAAAVLAIPYLVAALFAWRKWRSPLRTLTAGVVGAATAYLTLIGLLYFTIG